MKLELVTLCRANKAQAKALFILEGRREANLPRSAKISGGTRLA